MDVLCFAFIFLAAYDLSQSKVNSAAQVPTVNEVKIENWLGTYCLPNTVVDSRDFIVNTDNVFPFCLSLDENKGTERVI